MSGLGWVNKLNFMALWPIKLKKESVKNYEFWNSVLGIANGKPGLGNIEGLLLVT